MSARLLVIGLDAAESTLIEQWAREGFLPNISRLIREGVTSQLTNCLETLPGAIWPEIWSGRSVGQTGLYYHPEQLHTGEAVLRHVAYDEVNPVDNYWSAASRSGRRVCVVDQVQAVLDTTLNGMQVLEWGLHDRTFTGRCHPSDLEQDVKARYGEHPVRSCDRYGDSDAGRQALLDDLLDGAARKQKMLLDLLAREPWDLFSCTLAESHCVGHHFWGCLESGVSGRHASYPFAHRLAMRTVYKVLDDTIGKLIAGAGSATTTMVIASHGMGPARAGYHLLPEILARLGMGSDHGAARGGRLRTLQNTIKNNIPFPLLSTIRALAGFRLTKALQRGSGALRFPLESPATRAVAVPNNRVGGIRLNLKGREPFGSVEPGHDADAVTDDIRTELLKLTDPRTNEPIIDRVVTADEAFGRDHHADVPDLMVVFRAGDGPIDMCVSDRVGRIHIPYYSRRQHRGGDHTVQSRLWAVGPGIAAGARLPDARTLDIAPTILRLLDVPVSQDLDGRPIHLQAARVADVPRHAHA